MQKDFNSSANTHETEQALKSWGIKYKKLPDGTLFVPGNLDFSGKGLTQLPDMSAVSVGGSFNCHDNQLTSLEHAPHTVTGDLSCDNNQLASLEHAPQSVGGYFSCYNNQLISLAGAPQSVGGRIRRESRQRERWRSRKAEAQGQEVTQP